MKFPFSSKTKQILENEEKKSIFTKALIAFKIHEDQDSSIDQSTKAEKHSKATTSELVFEEVS
jgi:hypothetical protein